MTADTNFGRDRLNGAEARGARIGQRPPRALASQRCIENRERT